ncbi:uncharacterized protein [Clinocottus analis]|uniref:uncharacterized protein n=1 Tax=Clinocottus analis TaxID=304258 RepID=UPI0035BF2121
MEDGVRKETQRATTLVAPGLHAILLLVPVNQFTEVEGLVPAELEAAFGEDVLDHTIVLLTCGDYLMGKTAEEYLQKEHPGLRQMIQRCGGRYHVFNNRQRQNREQVRQLLEKVDDMVTQNGVFYMRTAQERELAQRVKERKRELLESYRAQKDERREADASAHIPETEAAAAAAAEERTRTRREEREEMEGSVSLSQRANGLHSRPGLERPASAEPHGDRQAGRPPSFRLNADGALLSQMSEVKSTPKVVTTFHHRMNSFEERSPEASPTSSPRSPVFTSSPVSASSFAAAAAASPSPSAELRLVLLGRSGAGKSAAGNNILGREGFASRPDSFSSITRECEKKKALVEGRRVAVVDTPDWFNSEQTPDEVRAQISSCVALSSPGPHAFLLCVPLDQPAKTELRALEALEAVFGPEAVQKHTLLLFTYVDKLRESQKAGEDGVEAYIAGQRGDLLKLVEKCQDRFHVLERGGGGGVAELLEKVDQMVKEGGGRCYCHPAFQEAEDKVRQRQVEIARERRSGKLDGEPGSERPALYPYMQPLVEAEEEVRQEEMEQTRSEAEKSVSAMNIESLPAVARSTLSPSLLHVVMEKMRSSAKMVPKLLANGSVWVGEGAKKVKGSPVWGSVGSGAQNVHKKLADSSVWGKVGAGAGHVSKLVGGRVPKVVVDGSAWVGSGAKSVAASPMWGRVGSGAAAVADGSVRVGAGIGTGAKNLAQSPVWGKVGSGAKSGAKLMAESSVRVGAGIGAGAKKVAQSPVWGKVGSGAKAGAKMVADSSVWEKIGTAARKVPMEVVGGALLGLVLGVVLGGVIGGAIGAAVGSAATEVGRRRFGKKSTSEKTDDAAKKVEGTVNDGVDSLVKHGEKIFKTE